MPLEVGKIPDPREIARCAHQQAEFPAPDLVSAYGGAAPRVLYLLTDENDGAVLRIEPAE
jgi:hypothetical protein